MQPDFLWGKADRVAFIPNLSPQWLLQSCKMQPDFLFGADGRKDPSRLVETSIKFHSAVVDSFARCFHWDRGLSGDRDMKLRFGYHSYTVHICCNYLYIDTDGYGYTGSNVGVCINNVIYIYWQFDIYIKFRKVYRWNTHGNQSRIPSSLCSASCDMKRVWRPQKIARQVILLWDAKFWLHFWCNLCHKCIRGCLDVIFLPVCKNFALCVCQADPW